mgnify:CR=1 FL=1
MTIRERKEREKEEMRGFILDAANEIITAEGIDNLSVRKIANKIEYSPSIIYHYFKDKDDIVANIMRNGYQKILSALSSVRISPDNPERALREMTRSYIEVSLKMHEEYMNVQLNSSPEILPYTASLFQGAAEKKPALKMLAQCLRDIYKDRAVSESFIELTAQVVAASSFGLIMKLIIEKDILPEEQKERLIEHYLKCIIDGMILGKPLQP